ncbi:hypothetical protein ACPCSC_23085 [Streptomyces lavendulocolor]|uniref:hypothetical protein n=1 Tax=Streptomyces lavendulocolor TaxID=67316 RepID=UPI003C2B91D2
MPGKLDPNLELAAQAGDAAAMRELAKFHHSTASRDLAEHWQLAAAEAGDPEAMYDLARLYKILYPQRMKESPPDLTERLDFMYWLRRAADAGHVRAMEDMVECSTSPDEEEFWLRKAAEGSSPSSAMWLARRLEEKGQPAEAERWYRAAIDNRYAFVGFDLASLLIRQGRLDEAERYARLAAEAGSSSAAQLLTELLERLGRAKEASVWRAQIETLRARALWPSAAAPPQLYEVVATAVVTTAVVPFVQTLAGKVAEDAYGQARQLVRRLLRRNGRDDRNEEASQASAPTADTEPGLAILQDPDAGITLFLWSDASDEALRALSSLELGELRLRRPDQGRVHLVWHPASGTWRIRGC